MCSQRTADKRESPRSRAGSDSWTVEAVYGESVSGPRQQLLLLFSGPQTAVRHSSGKDSDGAADSALSRIVALRQPGELLAPSTPLKIAEMPPPLGSELAHARWSRQAWLTAGYHVDILHP